MLLVAADARRLYLLSKRILNLPMNGFVSGRSDGGNAPKPKLK